MGAHSAALRQARPIRVGWGERDQCMVRYGTTHASGRGRIGSKLSATRVGSGRGVVPPSWQYHVVVPLCSFVGARSSGRRPPHLRVEGGKGPGQRRPRLLHCAAAVLRGSSRRPRWRRSAGGGAGAPVYGIPEGQAGDVGACNPRGGAQGLRAQNAGLRCRPHSPQLAPARQHPPSLLLGSPAGFAAAHLSPGQPGPAGPAHSKAERRAGGSCSAPAAAGPRAARRPRRQGCSRRRSSSCGRPRAGVAGQRGCRGRRRWQ